MSLSALLSTFGLVFVAELGDKTQLAVMTQTCKYRAPWAVFVGGSLALTAVTALGAVGGQVLGTLIPESVLRFIAALAFIVMGALIWREASKSSADQTDEEEAETCTYTGDTVCADGKSWNWQAFSSTLLLLFLAELGDKTQLAVLGLASKQASPWGVFIGGALALTTVTAFGVVGGQQLCKLIPESLLLKISAGAFVVLGALMAAGVI